MNIFKSLFAIAALSFVMLPAVQADEPAQAKSELSEKERTELEGKLEAARGRLEDAAREVADLSGKLTGPIAQDFFIANRMGRGGARLGIGIADDKEGAKGGVAVEDVMPEGPAGKAGIKAGDVIVSVDGKSLKDSKNPSRDLVKQMRGVTPGQKVKVEYLRGGKKQTTELTAEAMNMQWGPFGGGPGDRMMYRGQLPMAPGMPAAPGMPPMPGDGAIFTRFLSPDVLDMELVSLTPKLGRYFGAEKGVLVVRAPSDSSIKLEEGDVILDIDGRQPQSGVHAMRILRSYQPGESVNFNVLRDRKSMKVAVTVPEPKHWKGTGPRTDGPGPRTRTFKVAPPPREETT